MQILGLFVMYFAVASADVIHEGPCPGMKPVEKLNLTAYQGVWYEISKLPAANEENGSCASAEYKLDGDIVKVKNTHVVGDVQKFVEGTAKFADDANGSGKVIVNFSFGEISTESTLLILATDYTSYAVSYTCKFDEKNNSHQVNLWILSRTKTLEGEGKTVVDNLLKENSKEIDESKLVETDFSEDACRYSSSSVVIDPAKL
uniref:Biliverdin binding protein-1 n=1 Tax=Antheraea pernyi TaxID=7119 RepID=I0C0B5_ANTPE|nr:biliverdin binding protein-1 [Antheraea pernyi]